MEQYSISIVANFRPSMEDNSNTRKISLEKQYYIYKQYVCETF